jgi:arylsulfatase
MAGSPAGSAVRLLVAALVVASLPVHAGASGRGTDDDPLTGANVLLVVVDALRADHLGCYGYARPTSPGLDARARQGVLFESVTSAAPQTVPSVLSLWSSLYPHRHGNQYFRGTRSFRVPKRDVRPRVPDGIPLLATELRAAGYRTGAVVTNPWLATEFGFDRGFERYVHLDRNRRARNRRARDHARAGDVNRRALHLLREWRRERFFLYLHYMDVHSPYDPPPRARELFDPGLGRYVYDNGPAPDLEPEDLARTRALYDAEIRGLDAHLSWLHRRLRLLGLLDRTIVVFTADHGDEFHEHGGLGHGTTLHRELVRVPLVVWHPSLTPRRVTAPVASVDLMPTLLDLVGVPVPPERDGVSLARLLRGEATPPRDRILLSELGRVKAVRRGTHKLIRIRRGDDRTVAYDLARDPQEQHPLDEPPAWPRLDARLDALSALGPTWQRRGEAPPEARPLDPERERQLEALGYLR